METACREAQQGITFKAQFLTICAYEVDFVNVVDLIDAQVRSARTVASTDLAGTWEDLAFKARSRRAGHWHVN